MAFGEEETHTGRMEDTLESASLKTYREREKERRGKVGMAGRGYWERYILHGKSLFVVSTGDLEHISLEFISNRISSDFLANLPSVSTSSFHMLLLQGNVLSCP